MSSRLILQNLKSFNQDHTNVSLAIVKASNRNRTFQYVVKYVPLEESLERRIQRILLKHIENSNAVEEYSYDCPEPEADLVRAINYESTDFYRIFEILTNLNPEEDVIENVEELIQAKAYMIILRNREGIQIVGFKTLPENWKMKRSRGLIPLLFKDNRFEDLEDDNIFSISNSIDLIYFDELLFILSKKEFERGLNFRDGMINNANLMYEEVQTLNLFVNLDLLISKVSNNQRYLRKIATIKNLGHYRNPAFLQNLQRVSALENWNVQFRDNQIVFTDENLDDILTLLQNKRLHSQLTLEYFDVESAKPL